MEEQQDTVPDKAAYQANRRKMCWAALAMMIATTVVTLLDPERVKAAESILMTQYLALSGLVATYFGFGGKK